MTKLGFSTATVVLAVLGGMALTQVGSQEAPAGPPAVSEGAQPILFTHDVHAETYGIDCQYCHFSAERSVDAGLPPVETCMGCHRWIPGETAQAQAEIAKIAEYANSGEPIPWRRVYKVSDHAHFPHNRHINAGLRCQECHGEVQTMGVISERDPVWGGDNMGWCVRCHVERDVTRDCTVCHY